MVLRNVLGGHNTSKLNRTDSRSFGNLSRAFGNLSDSPLRDEKAELPIRVTEKLTFFFGAVCPAQYSL